MADPTPDDLLRQLDAIEAAQPQAQPAQGSDLFFGDVPAWNYAAVAIVVIGAITIAVIISKLARKQYGNGSKVTEGFRRLALALGSLTAISGVVFGLSVANYLRMDARIEYGRNIDLRLFYISLGGIVGFLSAYGLLRLLAWIVDGFVSGVKGRRIAVALVFLAGVIWLWSPFEIFLDEITAYTAECINGQKILSLGLAMEQYKDFNERYQQMRDAERNCDIETLSRTTYSINRARSEVYYKAGNWDNAPVDKLVNCAILSRTDWSCEYPNGIDKVEFIDGLTAIRKEREGEFYMRRWQWWTATLLGLLRHEFISYDAGVYAPWLIPEQKTNF